MLEELWIEVQNTEQEAVIKTYSRKRNITLPTKLCLVQAMVFLVGMYGCDTWTIKKVKH